MHDNDELQSYGPERTDDNAPTTPTTSCKKAPKKPDDWKAPSQLSRTYAGTKSVIKERLQALRERLIKDLVAAGLSSNEALDLVEYHLIGYRVGRGGPPTLAASPDAIRIFDEEESRRPKLSKRARSPTAPPKTDGWRSARDLQGNYAGGVSVILERLKRLRDSFIDHMMSLDVPKEEAITFVENCLIGTRKLSTKSGAIHALSATSDAIRVGEENGYLVRKKQDDGDQHHR